MQNARMEFGDKIVNTRGIPYARPERGRGMSARLPPPPRRTHIPPFPGRMAGDRPFPGPRPGDIPPFPGRMMDDIPPFPGRMAGDIPPFPGRLAGDMRSPRREREMPRMAGDLGFNHGKYSAVIYL